ncbi:MAG: carboxypeptidase regulatory-like domain-containing protein [Bryobacterales bacterium]|nr:carboxypeptidase regulatory-like domain-containing protein [Bryobacterales bacterium]
MFLRHGLLVMAVLFPVLGQTPPEAERFLSGVVLDGETQQPVEGALVSLVVQNGAGVRTGNTPFGQESGTAVSSAGGTFAFPLAGTSQAARFSVRAMRDGYAMPNSFGAAGLLDYSGHLDPEEQTTQVRLRLYRVNRIAGRLVDEETQQPLEGIRVEAWISHFWQGRKRVMAADDATTITDPGGRFEVPGLFPGDYYFRMDPRPDLTGDDPSEAATGYPASFWPGPSDAGQGTTLAYGADLDLGDVRIASRELYGLRVTIPDDACGGKSAVSVSLHQSLAGVLHRRASRQTRCGEQIAIGGLEPGPYILSGSAGAKRFRQRLTVVNRSQEVILDLVPDLEIAGQVVVPEGAARSVLGSVRIGRRILDDAERFGTPDPVMDANGRFEIKEVRRANYRIWLQGLPSGYYVDNLSYNGTSLEGGILRVNPGSLEQFLKITVAQGTGTVLGGAPGAARVFLLRKIREAFWFLNLAIAEPDGQGQFRFEDVAPGDYWIFTTDASEAGRLHEPGVLAGWAARAREIDVGRNQVVRVNFD